MGALDMSLDEVITKSGDSRRGKGSGKNWESSKTTEKEAPKSTEGKSKDDLLSMSLDEMISASGSGGRRKGGGGGSWGKGGGKGKGGYSYSYSGANGGEGSSWGGGGGGVKDGGWSGGYDGGRGRGSSWSEGAGGGGGMRGWGDSWGGGGGGGWSGGRDKAAEWTEHDDRKGGGGGGGWSGSGGGGGWGGGGGGDWGSSGYDRGTKRPREAARAPKTPTRIKVTNIPSDLTKEDIKEAFESEAGPTTSVKMSKGTAYIEFEEAEGAKTAVETFDRGELNGKIISVTYDQ